MKKVILKLFQDDATGAYGVAPENTIDRGFNAFWNGIGIFHDVFEHHQEDNHKYFKGDYAFNVGGEMMASGASYYYTMKLGVYNRIVQSFDGWDRSIIRSGYNEFIDLLAGNGSSGTFGETLLSNVPYQKPINMIDSSLEDAWEDIMSYHPDSRDDLDTYEAAMQCKRSITRRKFFDLYRYGFRYAERFIPDNYSNCNVLIEFIEFWNEVTNKVNVEELYSVVDSIQFNISKSAHMVTCTSYLNLRNNKQRRIKSIRDFDVYDLYSDDY